MRHIRLGITACVCGVFATAAPALAETGNTATSSTGVVQVGTVNADPSATVGSPAGGATAAAPSGSTAGDNGGSNSASGSTGAVQSSPTSLHPRVRASHGSTRVVARVPVGIGSGNNTASGSTGAAQVGGGNTSTGSTGTAQISGTGAGPSATVSPAGSNPTSVGGSFGIDGSGNSASGSTGAAQIGGGNTATDSLGPAQSAGPQVAPTLDTGTPPALADILTPFSLSGAPDGPPTALGGTAAGSLPATGSTAMVAATPTVTSQEASPPAATAAQGEPKDNAVSGAVQSIGHRIVAGALPFTGLALAAWALIALLAVGIGTALKARGAQLA